MLLLELPQLGVDIEGATEVSLPLPVAILRQIPVIQAKSNYLQQSLLLLGTDLPEPVEELLGLLEQVAELQN